MLARTALILMVFLCVWNTSSAEKTISDMSGATKEETSIVGEFPISGSSYIYYPSHIYLEAYTMAEKQYSQALQQKNMSVRKAWLTKAITSINQVKQEAKPCINRLFLSSRIYRAYGISSYANGYFEQCTEVVEKALLENSDNLQYQLDLAILYFAGEKRYSEDYEQYKKLAQYYAKKVVDTLEDGSELSGVDYYQLFLAQLILDNKAKALANLKASLNCDLPADKNYLENCIQYLNYSSQKNTSEKLLVYDVEFLAYSFGKVHR